MLSAICLLCAFLSVSKILCQCSTKTIVHFANALSRESLNECLGTFEAHNASFSEETLLRKRVRLFLPPRAVSEYIYRHDVHVYTYLCNSPSRAVKGAVAQITETVLL